MDFCKKYNGQVFRGEIRMDIINNYLNLLYKDDDSIEVIELKEEIREHLILSANEFINQGWTEKEAYNKAIEKFDGGSEMLKELYATTKENNKKHNQVHALLKKITSKALNISMGLFILSLVMIIATLIIGRTDLIEEIHNAKSSERSYYIGQKLNEFSKDRDINKLDEYKDELNKLVNSNEFKKVDRLRIYNNETFDKINLGYVYGSENNSTFLSAEGNTEKNDLGQEWHYIVDIGEEWYFGLNESVMVSAIFIMGISCISYIYFMITSKKNKSLIY